MGAISATRQMPGPTDIPGPSPTREVAMWISSPSGPLCGRLHLPVDGLARGVVVLCPPLAREHVVTHPTFRQLSEELAMAGFAALRVDYHGTGDSAGSFSDPDRVATWQQGVRQAVRAAHDLDCGPVTVVGMRMGALLAATALSGHEVGVSVDQLILWDTCSTGRAWLREQVTLLEIGVGSSGYGAVPTPGDAEDLRKASLGREGLVDIPSFTFTEVEAAAISALDIMALEATAARRIVAVHREERAPRASVATHLADLGVEVTTSVGQSELLVIASSAAIVPVQGLRQVISTIVEQAPAERSICKAPEGTSATLQGSSATGAAYVEEHVRIGPVGLVGVRTRPVEALAGAPEVIFLANTNEPHFGPSRAWVEMGRQWAAQGITSTRLCLSGLGDSPVRPGQRPQVVYAEESLADARDVIAAIAGDSPRPDVVLIGLCSGGYMSMESAMVTGARAVCALGVQPGAGVPLYLLDLQGAAPAPAPIGKPTQRKAAAPVKGWAYRAAQQPLAWKVARRLPGFFWNLLDRLNVLPSPARPLQQLADAGVETFFLVGKRDARPYQTLANAKVRRLERRGKLTFSSVPALDHGMLRAGPREQALKLLDAHVREHFITPYQRTAS